MTTKKKTKHNNTLFAVLYFSRIVIVKADAM